MAIIERGDKGRFQRVTPTTVGKRLDTRHKAQSDTLRRRNAQRRGYAGPLTRSDLTR